MLHSPTFWVAVAFVIFVAFIWWKALKPVLNSLDQRGERIKKELEEAQNLRDEAQHTLAEYRRKQRDAADEAKAIIDHAKVEAVRLREQAEQDLEAALARRERAAMEKIAQAEARALSEVRNQAVDVAITATRQLLSEQMDKDKAATLLDQSIAELEQKLH